MSEHPDRAALLDRLGSEPGDPHVSIGHDSIDDVDPPLVVGQRVGDYVIEGEIGAGACGRVYRARHPVLGREAAIKVLHRRWSVDPSMVARFVAEARAVNRVRHPGIVDIYAFGSLADSQQYCVMELLAGRTLAELLEERGRLSLTVAMPLLRAIAEALGAAHAAGIAHRDLKPANIFITDDPTAPGGSRPTILDFGMAKLVGDGDGGTGVTRTGAAVGTPAYMAPEQCLGRSVGTRADVYAFGLLAWRTLAGHHPFEADSAFEMMAAQIGEPAPDINKVVPELPRGLHAALESALAKDPDQRAPSALAVVAQLDAAVSGLPERRRRWPWFAAAVAVALLSTAWLTLDQPDEIAGGLPPLPPNEPVMGAAPAAPPDPTVAMEVPPDMGATVTVAVDAAAPAPAPIVEPSPQPPPAAARRAEVVVAPPVRPAEPVPRRRPEVITVAPTAPVAAPPPADSAAIPRASESKPPEGPAPAGSGPDDDNPSRGLHDLEPWE